MKILVLSDSHGARRHMKLAIDRLKPDAVVHLGDFYDDAAVMAEEYPHLVFHRVPGNCDRFRCDPYAAQTLCYDIGGVRLYMTHGHLHGVKTGDHRLVADARSSGAQVVLYGHTHSGVCRQDNGLWVMNPGTCGHSGGTVGLIETENNAIGLCRLFGIPELEEMK